jgi:hypothetical protein
MIIEQVLAIFGALGLITLLAVSSACAHHVADADPRRVGDQDVGRIRSPRARARAEVESHDIDDMVDAIDAYRRREGRRSIAEELSDEALRATWDE